MHRKELDGLRAVAVASVILNHFDKNFAPNGHLGVDIFYAISGFVITQSLLEREHGTFRKFILGFWTRRVKRLAPALFLCVATTALLTFLFSSPEASSSYFSLRTGVAALFGLSNLYLLKQAANYFSTIAELNSFTHTWSLGVEEQFYFLFPFLFWTGGLLNKSVAGERRFLLILSSLTVFSLYLYSKLSAAAPVAAFYFMPARFWEISFGSIALVGLKKLERSPNYNSKIFAYTADIAFLFLIAFLFVSGLDRYQGLITFAVVSLTTIILFTVRHNSVIYKILTLRTFAFLGIISYSLYLWHWSILSASRWTIGIHWWSIPFQLLLILILATLSYKYIERPLRRSDWPTLKFSNAIKIGPISYAFGTALIISLSILFIGVPVYKKGFLYTGSVVSLKKKGVETLEENETHKQYIWNAKQCVLSSNDDVGKKISPENCTFGDFYKAKRRFLVIGNSFSAAEMPMFKILESEGKGAAMITSSWGAAPIPEINNKGQWEQANQYYWNTVFPELVDKLRPGDAIIMINDGAPFSPKASTEATKKNLQRLENGLSNLIKKMSERGLFVIYQSGIPLTREANCNPDIAMPQWWNIFGNSPCIYYSREATLERRKNYHDLLLKLEKENSNFFVLDIFDVFCASDTCKFYKEDGTVLYRDEFSHPSVEASILSQPLLLKTVDRMPANF
ncbi:hypothetical protein CH373_04880 [Leptospira perolatii]|uniref:Acyltransferase n=1 Tax=Leptospira perolatii TaxID=2023191 RepID=A0A2M9ZQ94_9LEPT|nr:acyltransferase family protein [Leptospira perolatii]PJZ70411.1 hypothetical protein CH360_05300 [Leptospira perolatii]PJZ74247.1 hypothetical protein CH373_04880 [Leptospira perolatii]